MYLHIYIWLFQRELMLLSSTQTHKTSLKIQNLDEAAKIVQVLHVVPLFI